MSTADEIKINGSAARKPEHPIQKIFLDRWSPRAMSAATLSDEELLPLFEAARWAASSYNNQPWRFLYARRDTPNWQLFLNLLGEFNQGWAKNAAALVAIVSRKNFEHNNKPSVTHALDTGAAWGYLALEGAFRGLVVHGMEGFDYARAKKDLSIPDGYEVHAMAAIGKPGTKSQLSPELQQRETPSGRKPLAEIICEGKFQFKS